MKQFRTGGRRRMMNNEERLIFKAKTTKKENPKHAFSEVWVEGNLIMSDGKYYIHPTANKVSTKGEVGKMIVMHEVTKNTICKHTGLKDKNNKEIWENDILCGRLDEEDPENITYKKVIWDMNGFYTKEEYSIDFEPLDEFDAERFETCGNIFDNPELLEVKK